MDNTSMSLVRKLGRKRRSESNNIHQDPDHDDVNISALKRLKIDNPSETGFLEKIMHVAAEDPSPNSNHDGKQQLMVLPPTENLVIPENVFKVVIINDFPDTPLGRLLIEHDTSLARNKQLIVYEPPPSFEDLVKEAVYRSENEMQLD